MIILDMMILKGFTNEFLPRSGMVKGIEVVTMAMIFVTGDLLVDMAEVLRKYRRIKRM
jgi:succinate dehydrogenase/fumarate reductase-like Fe-S protein